MEVTANQKKFVITLTIILGCAIVIMSLITNSQIQNSLPPLPDLGGGNGKSPDVLKQEVDNYKALSAAIKENKSYLNELLVAKFIKPLFDALLTAIIGFIFAKPLINALAQRITNRK